MMDALTSRLTLNNGTAIPRLGIGTWRAPSGIVTEEAVLYALRRGYRHIDTAAVYGNERDVGNALRKSGVPREDVFLTTKLWNDDMRGNRQMQAFEESMERLGTDYVDLYLIHWPVEHFEQSWKVLEEIYASGRARAIGVSNFKKHHLEALLQTASVVPAVDQMEFSPYMQDTEALAFCRELGIVYEAWSPLGAGHYVNDPVFTEIGRKYGKTAAQVILRWVLQQDIVVFPKSVHAERIDENANLFDFFLTEDEMKRISSLNRMLRTGSDPDTFTF